MNQDMAVGLWMKLESLYMTKSITNILYLECLYTMKMKEATPFHDHYDEFNNLISNIDVKIEDEDKALGFLYMSILLLHRCMQRIQYIWKRLSQLYSLMSKKEGS